MKETTWDSFLIACFIKSHFHFFPNVNFHNMRNVAYVYASKVFITRTRRKLWFGRSTALVFVPMNICKYMHILMRLTHMSASTFYKYTEYLYKYNFHSPNFSARLAQLCYCNLNNYCWVIRRQPRLEDGNPVRSRGCKRKCVYSECPFWWACLATACWELVLLLKMKTDCGLLKFPRLEILDVESLSSSDVV